MNKQIRKVKGITLIETMLVLAIAAVVIVMSVRYFEATQNSSLANTYAMQIQRYIAGGESIYSNTGAFPSATGMEGILPGGANAWKLPWGGSGTYAAVTGPVGFTFTHPTSYAPPAACALIKAKFANNPKIYVTPACVGIRYRATY